MRYIIVFLSVFTLLISACKEDYTPKRKGYFRIDFPKKEYVTYDTNCPFTFDYPVYAGVFPDSSRNTEPCWLNVRYYPFNATLHLTYKNFNGDKNILGQLEEQSRKYAYEHTIKAQDITPLFIDDSTNNVFITAYALEGETATSFRFSATDKLQHYIDGAFYFNHKTNIDSVAPVQKYLMKDIDQMLQTLNWK